MRIAIAVAAPASAALNLESSSTFHVASAQNAAAGTSLIGSLIIVRNAGLVATSQAAPRPRRSDRSCRPMPNVAQIKSPAVIGTTRKSAACPATAFIAAISSGSPGPTMGAIADSFATAA